MEEQNNVVQRRKGQPKKPDREPLLVKVLRCADLWILTCAVVVFVSMFWLWALHNIRLVTTAAQALSQMTAEAVDRDAARIVAEELLQIREEAPKGATRDYTSDEQVVLLGRYRDLETTSEWISLQRYLTEVSGRYPYADEFSLVLIDEAEQQLVWLVSPAHPTGYSARLSDLALPGEDGYEASAFAGHREGTAVLCSIPDTGDTKLCICAGFSFAGIMGTEVRKLLIPFGLALVILLFATIRLVWVVHHKLTQLEEEWGAADGDGGDETEPEEEDA